MSAFAYERLPGDLGPGTERFQKCVCLNATGWISVPSTDNSPPHPTIYTPFWDTGILHSEGKDVIHRDFPSLLSVTLISNKPVLKRRKEVELAWGNNRFFPLTWVQCWTLRQTIRNKNPNSTKTGCGFHQRLNFPFPAAMPVDFQITCLEFQVGLFQMGADRFSRCDLLTPLTARKCLALSAYLS